MTHQSSGLFSIKRGSPTTSPRGLSFIYLGSVPFHSVQSTPFIAGQRYVNAFRASALSINVWRTTTGGVHPQAVDSFLGQGRDAVAMGDPPTHSLHSSGRRAPEDVLTSTWRGTSTTTLLSHNGPEGQALSIALENKGPSSRSTYIVCDWWNGVLADEGGVGQFQEDLREATGATSLTLIGESLDRHRAGEAIVAERDMHRAMLVVQQLHLRGCTVTVQTVSEGEVFKAQTIPSLQQLLFPGEEAWRQRRRGWKRVLRDEARMDGSVGDLPIPGGSKLVEEVKRELREERE